MLGIAFILSACILWSLDTLIRYPLLGEGVRAESIVFMEHLVLFILFFPVTFKLIKSIKSVSPMRLLDFIIIGGFGSALGTLCFTRAFSIVNPSLVILLQKLQPVLAIFLANVILKEPLHKKFLYWAVVCILGGILISYQQIMPGLGELNFNFVSWSNKELFGIFLALVSVVSWGASTVFGKRLSLASFTSPEIMAGRFSFGFICLTPLLFTGLLNFNVEVETYKKLSIMILLSGVLAMYLYYRGLKNISARLCALLEMFFPFFAILVNWIFLDAKLDLIQISGAIILLTGSTVVQVKHY